MPVHHVLGIGFGFAIEDDTDDDILLLKWGGCSGVKLGGINAGNAVFGRATVEQLGEINAASRGGVNVLLAEVTQLLTLIVKHLSQGKVAELKVIPAPGLQNADSDRHDHGSQGHQQELSNPFHPMFSQSDPSNLTGAGGGAVNGL